jgi:acyl-CoA thioesterase
VSANDTAFDAATAVVPAGPLRYTAEVDQSWHVRKGANGGVVAAVLLRAMIAAVDDPARLPRSLTVHYPAAFEAGPTVINVAVERAGRSMSTLSARAVQGDRTVALALGAFSTSWPGVSLHDMTMPDVPPPSECPAPVRPGGEGPPFAGHYEYALAAGPPPFSGADTAEAAVWMRPADHPVLDYPLLAALTDAFWPVIFATQQGPVMAPTIDLTVHFRAPLAASAEDRGPWLGVFRTRLAADGFMEEDGEVWSADGTLLAQSRQLALAVPAP